MLKTMFALTAITTSIFLTSGRNPSNPPAGVTGAPNEKTCSTQSGCHFGGVYEGRVEISGLPEEIEAATTYTMQLKVIAPTAKRGGFQITALNENNAMQGAFKSGSGVSVKNSGGRNYATQSNAKNYSGDSVVWNIQWTSPTIISDTVTFYFVGLAANGNGGTSGDNAHKSQFSIPYKMTSSTININSSVQIFPNPASDYFKISSQGRTGIMHLYGTDGRRILKQDFIDGQVIDVSHLPRGMYAVKLIETNREVKYKLVLN